MLWLMLEKVQVLYTILILAVVECDGIKCVELSRSQLCQTFLEFDVGCIELVSWKIIWCIF